jgi:hypothetical protein
MDDHPVDPIRGHGTGEPTGILAGLQPCTDPCDQPAHFVRHLRETMDRIIGLGYAPAEPRAVIRFSAGAVDAIRSAVPARDSHLRGHTVIGAIMDELASLPLRVDPAVPEGTVLLWRPPEQIRVSGDPRAFLDIEDA